LDPFLLLSFSENIPSKSQTHTEKEKKIIGLYLCLEDDEASEEKKEKERRTKEKEKKNNVKKTSKST
jgi:hypothetical protein